VLAGTRKGKRDTYNVYVGLYSMINVACIRLRKNLIILGSTKFLYRKKILY